MDQQRAIRGLLIAGGLYLGYRLGSSLLADLREQRTALQADNSPTVRQALALRSALNPSGLSWLMWADGTDEAAIRQLSGQISNLDAVITAYRALYRSELLEDLQGELSQAMFQEFLTTVSNNRINANPGGSTAGQGAYTNPGRLVVAKREVYVRTSPDASNHGAWYEVLSERNIFRTAKAGDFIGYATGRQHYDARNDVKFIEVGFRVSPSVSVSTLPAEYRRLAGRSQILWVSASGTYTEQFSTVAAMEARWPQTRGYATHLLPLSGLGWADGGTGAGSRVVTVRPTMVMDEGFRVLTQAEAGVLMGYAVMGLSGRGIDYTLVRTAGGQDRWLKTEDTRLV
jgi:hypothetical protein